MADVELCAETEHVCGRRQCLLTSQGLASYDHTWGGMKAHSDKARSHKNKDVLKTFGGSSAAFSHTVEQLHIKDKNKVSCSIQ